MRAWKRRPVAESTAAGVARAAAAGATRRELLKEAGAALLSNSEADRAGAWTESNDASAAGDGRGQEGFHGVVVNRNGEEAPAEWQRLSAEAPLPATLLAAGKTIEQNLDGSPGEPILGVLVDIRQALWVPVECSGRLHGVLMLGTHRRTGALPRAMAEGIATELALALELEEERRRARDHHEDLLMTKRWLGALTKMGPTDALLTSLVENCAGKSADKGGLGAVFAVLRAWEKPDRSTTLRPGSSSLLKEAVAHANTSRSWHSGDATWVRAVEKEPLAALWRRAQESHGLTGNEPGAFWPRGDAVRMVTIPLEPEGQPLGALVAGFRYGTVLPAVLERLELRAELASAALLLRQRNAEAAQQAAQQQTLLQSSSCATLLVDADAGISALSRGARRLLCGMIPADSAAANAEAGSPALRLPELFRARDQQHVQQWLQRSRESQAGQGLEEEVLEAELNSGVGVCLRCTAAPAGGLAGVSLDPIAVDTARAERAEAQLISVMEWLEEGVVLFDSDHKIRAMNTRFTQMAGLSPEEAVGVQTLHGLIARLASQATQPEPFAERWREQARGDAGTREDIQLLRPVPRVLERAARPITDGAGRSLGRVEIYRDLTAQRVFQSKLLQTEKLAALGQMMTGVAHELSNPLTSILGYAQRLFLRQGGAGGEEEVRQIFQEAERASAILRQLLMTARDSRPERRPVSLNQVVSRTLELQRFNLEAEKVRIVHDLDPALSLVMGDAGQLQQVLMNLIGNSRQAIEPRGSGGTVRLSTKRIADGRILLEVSDDGPGIPESILSRIFDPFFTTKPAGIGTGLGLAIVLGIVREHGGQVRVSSPPGGGAVFSLEFPAARAEEPRIQAGVATGPGKRPEPLQRHDQPGLTEHRPAAPSSFGKPRVLVVEDEPTVARLIADVLEDDGMQVDVLLDGRTALERVSRKDYDLVICDMKMPGLDGQHFYKRLANTGNRVREKFLFVTGDVIAAHTHEFLEHYHLPYVAKPFRVEELTEKVHRVLGVAPSHVPLPVQVTKIIAARK